MFLVSLHLGTIFYPVFPLWCVLHNKHGLTKRKKGNSIGKNVWFRTHVYVATRGINVAQQRPRFRVLPESEISAFISIYRCEGKCSVHRQEQECQLSIIRWSFTQGCEVKWAPKNSVSQSYKSTTILHISELDIFAGYYYGIRGLLRECWKTHVQYDGNPDAVWPLRSVFFVNPCLQRNPRLVLLPCH